jgi:hypothetical protein
MSITLNFVIFCECNEETAIDDMQDMLDKIASV